MRSADAVIGIYGMGLTQHRNGVENVQMLVNLLLLRGNIGKPGAGHLSGARPFERAGPAHGRHHRKARAGADRQAEGAVRVRAAARERPQHRRGLRGNPEGRGAARFSGSAAISCAPCPIAAAWSRPGASCG